jgi:hypothetical protein
VRDDADQARFIVERVPENREAGTLLKHQSVLFRTSGPGGIDAAVYVARSLRISGATRINLKRKM